MPALRKAGRSTQRPYDGQGESRSLVVRRGGLRRDDIFS
jgi:hypothetical protein